MSQLNNYTVSVIDGHEVMVFHAQGRFFSKNLWCLNYKVEHIRSSFSFVLKIFGLLLLARSYDESYFQCHIN